MRGTRGQRQRMARARWIALAVLLGALLVGLQPQGRGWRADHGHVTLGATVPAHAHPYDDPQPRQADTATASVGFTDPDGIDGGAVDVPASPMLTALRGVTFEVAAPASVVVSHHSIVLTPPPRA